MDILNGATWSTEVSYGNVLIALQYFHSTGLENSNLFMKGNLFREEHVKKQLFKQSKQPI